MPKRVIENRLLVEGASEIKFISHFMEQYTVWGDGESDWVIDVKALDGVANLLNSAAFSTNLKSPGLKRLGVVIDANTNFHARETAVRSLCAKFDNNFPTAIPQNGAIHVTTGGLRLGVWIMPDNRSPGMLESFATRLLNDSCQSLWRHAQNSTVEARNCGATFVDAHRDKAEIHTFLAWTDPPGALIQQLVFNKHLSADHPLGLSFANWMISLFELEPKPNVHHLFKKTK